MPKLGYGGLTGLAQMALNEFFVIFVSLSRRRLNSSLWR